MSTPGLLASDISEYSCLTPDPDIEPDEDWKSATRAQIQQSLQADADGVKAKRDQQLLHTHDSDVKQRISEEYERAMDGIRRLAHEQYMEALVVERQTRLWAAGERLESGWDQALYRDQQAILDDIKRKNAQQRQSEVTQDSADDLNTDAVAGPSGALEHGSREESSKPGRDIQKSSSGDDGEHAKAGSDDDDLTQEHAGVPTSSYSYPSQRGLHTDGEVGASSRTVGHDHSRGSVSRQQSSSSLSSKLPEIWIPAASDFSPATSRTLAAAIETTGGTPRTVSRSGSLLRHERPPSDAGASQGRAAVAPIEGLLSKTKGKQRESQGLQQIRPRTSTADFRPQMPVPVSPASPAYFPQTDCYSYQSPSAFAHLEAAEERAGIPIRGVSSSRQPSTPQGSPDILRYSSSTLTASRSSPKGQSFMRDSEYGQSAPSPPWKWMPPTSPTAPPAAPVPTRTLMPQRSFTRNNGHPPPPSPSSRVWQGSQSPRGSIRRQSSGSHSLRSQFSRQDFRTSYNHQQLQTFDERPHDCDNYESDSDSDLGIPDLELAERREEDEAEKRAMEARALAEAARRMEAEDKQKEAELRQKEEEARRIAAEAKQKEEEALRKEAEAKRKEAEVRRKEEEVRRKAEEARRKQEEVKRRAEEARRIEAEAMLKEAEARRQMEEARRKEAEFRLKEAEKRGKEEEAKRKAEEVYTKEEETRRKEEDIKKKEEELCRREADLIRREQEAILKGQDDDFLREQEELLRRANERKRQDSIGSTTDSGRSAGGRTSDSGRPGAGYPFSSVPPSSPWSIPNRYSSSSSSSSTDRSSTTSSSSWTSSSGWSSSGRSNTSAYTQASASSRTSSTPTSSTKPPSSGWTAGGATPTSASTSNKSKPGAPSSKPTTSFPSAGPIVDEEEEWRRRQEERAKKQQEQYQRMQEDIEQNKHAKPSRTMSKEDVVRLFEEHERRWAELPSKDVLTWGSFPWPMLSRPDDPDELTTNAISAYVLSPHYPGAKTPRDRIKDHIRRWHPDRFETKLLSKVREEEQEKVKHGAGLVARNLNEILTRQSNANDLF